MYFIPLQKFLPQNFFTNASFSHRFHLLECQTFLIALSSLIYQFSGHFYSKQIPPNGYDWHMKYRNPLLQMANDRQGWITF